MPVRTFWSYVKNTNRLQCERDLRQLDIVIAAQSPKYAEKLRERLIEGLGEITKGPDTPVNHSEGVKKLASLLS